MPHCQFNNLRHQLQWSMRESMQESGEMEILQWKLMLHPHQDDSKRFFEAGSMPQQGDAANRRASPCCIRSYQTGPCGETEGLDFMKGQWERQARAAARSQQDGSPSPLFSASLNIHAFNSSPAAGGASTGSTGAVGRRTTGTSCNDSSEHSLTFNLKMSSAG